MRDGASCKLTFEWESDLNDLITLSFDGMVIARYMTIVEANNAFLELTELEKREVFGKTIDGFVREKDREKFASMLKKKGRADIEIALSVNDRVIYTVCRHKKIDDYDAFVFKDITQSVLKEREFDMAQRRHLTIVNATIEGFWMLDENRNITEVNIALSKMLGYEPSMMLGKTPYEFVDDNNKLFMHYQVQKIDETDHRNYEIELQKKDGTNIPVNISATTVRDKKGKFLFSFAFIKDISENKKIQERLQELAQTDRLTGVKNRLKLEEVLALEIKRSQRYMESRFSIILFDIDRFKDVNDTYGHDVGDEVLKSVSRLAEKNLRDSDMFGRWGGEEFLIILPGTDLEQGKKVAQKLRKIVEKGEMPNSIKITASFGVSEFKEGDSIDTLIKRADNRLYDAKRTGRNKVVYKD